MWRLSKSRNSRFSFYNLSLYVLAALISFGLLPAANLLVYGWEEKAIPDNAAVKNKSGSKAGKSGSKAAALKKKTAAKVITKKAKPAVAKKLLPTKPKLVSPDFKTPLSTILKRKGTSLPLRKPRLVVEKSKRRLHLYSGNILLKSYPIGLGPSPKGSKLKEGDGKTPEGQYVIATKESLPANERFGTRWVRISYPGPQDAKRGLAEGIINEAQYRSFLAESKGKALPPQSTPLGGGIGLHGASPGFLPPDFTRGCMGFNNGHLEELFEVIPIGTPVTIRP